MRHFVYGLVGGAMLAVVLAACGDEPGSAARIGELEARGELVDSQSRIPDEPAFDFADIVTEEAGAPDVWERFRLAGQPPAVDWDDSALLIVGFGESGSCPATFEGLRGDGDQLRMEIGQDGGPDCTDDYNPRTFVVEFSRQHLPETTFWLTVEREWPRRFALAGSPQPQPPTGSVTLEAIPSDPGDVELRAEPPSVAAGQVVEIVLRNGGSENVSGGGDAASSVLQRWKGQRWLPAPGQSGYEPHAAVALDSQTAEPGQEGTIATIDTDVLEPGWYGLRTRIHLSGRGGYVETRAVFEVTG